MEDGGCRWSVAVVAAAAVMKVVNEVSRCRCRLMSMMSVPRGGQLWRRWMEGFG